MAEVVDAEAEEEETTVARPLPMGLAEAGLLELLGTMTVSRWEEEEADVCSNGDAVMFARAGG